MKYKVPSLFLLLFLALMPISTSVFAQNIIVNGDFSSGELTPWTFGQFEGASATATVDNDRVTISGITTAGTNSWHLQLNQVLTDDQKDELEIGSLYELSFRAISSAERSLTVYFGQDGGSFTSLALVTLTIPAGTSTQTVSVPVTQTFDNMKLGFELGLSNVEIAITDVALVLNDPEDDPDALFTDITVASGKDFTLTKVEIGALNFIDRNHTITSIPAGLNLFQATMLRGANDDRDRNEASGYITFELKEDATIYVAYDNRRVSTAPAWLSDNWTNTGEVIGTSDVAYALYSRSYTAGQTVDIGAPFAPPQSVRPNGLFVLANDGGELPTETDPSENVMDENFILFANGRNVTIPGVLNGAVVVDPVDGEDNVLEFNYGNWNIGGFNWGASAINMQNQFDEGDMIHMRIWSSPNNSTASRATNGNNTAKIIFQDGSTLNSLMFRAQLDLPDEVHTGTWMDISIPLPKFASRVELDSAKVGRNADGSVRAEGALTGYDALWDYWGTFSNARGSVIVDVNDPDWREFNWNRVRTFGIYWDQAATPNAPIYINNVYIGKPDVDLSIALDPPAPITTVQVSSEGGLNAVSFTPRYDIGGYNLYFSGSPITDLEAPEVFFWKNIPRTATDFSATHRVVSPHPIDPEHTYYYAVAPTNLWGRVNNDVSSSATSITARGTNNAFIFQLDASEENTILDNLENGVVSIEGWPTDLFQPFRLRGETSIHPSVPPSDETVSADIYAAYGTSEGELIFYVHASVIDNDLQFNPMVVDGSNNKTFDWNSYKRDQVEIRIGGYDVDFVTGATNDGIEPGADFLINLRPYAEVAAFAGASGSILANPTGIAATFNGITDYQFTFPPAMQLLEDDDNNVIGYEIMFAFTYNEIRAPFTESERPDFVAPGRGEFKYIPFTLSVVDDRAESAGRAAPWEQAAYQLFDSWKPNFGSSFFNTPNNLAAVAIAGRDVPTSIDFNDPIAQSPREIRLNQNFPNPFNPTTTISFTLPDGDQNVNLSVYNTIGQRVAVLVNNQQLASGVHQISFDGSRLSSGMYLYRLEVGDRQFVRKMMLIK